MSKKKRPGNRRTPIKRDRRDPAPSAPIARPRIRPLGWILTLAIAFAVVLFIRAAHQSRPPLEAARSPVHPQAPPTPPARFVGSAACAGCHQRENTLWRGSHHQLAMLPADAAGVLGDFNHAIITNDGVTSTFFRDGARFMVRTDGPDGALHDYSINYTFGVYPLQQYLIAMPGGRLQALGIAWDSRPRAGGGQRWFLLYPGRKLSPSDPLHWTGIDQNWNYMCADCHSTNLRKNYSLQSRTYATAFAEIDVACEACHGPGSNHVSWSRNPGDSPPVFRADHGLTIALNERNGIGWSINPATGNPERSAPRISEREIQLCARCHSRRAELHEDIVHGQPVGDDYRVALLDQDLYFPDGQIKGEVYEYGSFIQSRMFHAGVTCSDCHEPHSLKLRADGNGVCLQCHYAPRYDSPKHHFHQVGSPGAQCVACHMPTRTYMVVDPRRDHSLRIPRPDLSIKLGTPNACTNCHSDKPAQWAADSIVKWYGRTPSGFQHFADALQAGREQTPAARQSLIGLIADPNAPAIARATALSILAADAPAPSDATVRAAVADPSPLVRRAAAHALSNVDPAAAATTLAPLLSDPVRTVRIETADVLAGLSADTLPPAAADSMRRATDEYVAAQLLGADRPEAHLNLALLYARQNRPDQAADELKCALSLDPAFAPAAVNLADLYRDQNRDSDGARVLHDAISHSPDDASLQYALGLLMVRQHQNSQALDLLAAAARLDPANPRYSYVYAVALDDAGQTNAAIVTLQRNISLHPYDRDSLAALAAFCDRTGQSLAALSYARRLYDLDPQDPQARQMLQTLNGRLHH